MLLHSTVGIMVNDCGPLEQNNLYDLWSLRAISIDIRMITGMITARFGNDS